MQPDQRNTIKDRRQHIVPQMMIRRFANDDGKLFELRKQPKLALGTRLRSPKGILWRDVYYRDRLGDFDADLIKTIENKFGKYYHLFTDGDWDNSRWAGDGDCGSALIEWAALTLARSPMVRETMLASMSHDGDPICQIIGRYVPDEMCNDLRAHQFMLYRDLFCRPQFRWKCRQYPISSLVITDNPLCSANIGGRVYLFPLSKHRILIGGYSEDVDQWRNVPARFVNFWLASWAERSVFAADQSTLVAVMADLNGEGIITSPYHCERGRKPLAGHIEWVRRTPVPEDVDLTTFPQDALDSFGPSKLPPELRPSS